MSKRSGLIIGTLLAAVLTFGLATPSNSLAGSTCPGGSISNTTVKGGLTVTSDCTVTNSTIHGGINQTGGNLTVCGSTVDGGVTSNGASSVVFGENNATNPPCPGDQINGHVTVSNSPLVEFDQSPINGGGDFLNDGSTEFELEGENINGSVNCAGSATIVNDEACAPGSPVGSGSCPNSATGQVVNCMNF